MAGNYGIVNSQNTRAGQSYSATYAAGNACEAIMLPIIDAVGVQLSFDSAGTAKVQATLSDYNTIDAGAAIWVDWDAGDVTVSTQASCHKATAVRVYRTSGTPRITVTA